MEKFKVKNITVFSKCELFNEEKIKGVLELTRGRYKHLDLEMYLYETNFL